jgi:FMN reductase
MKNVALIATSLNPVSKSQQLAARFAVSLQERGVAVETIDLREHDLPLAGAPGCWDHPNLPAIQVTLERASHIVFAVPVYCYSVSSATKNVIDLLGRSFTDKVIGFMCAAGGQGSYMAVMGFANSLMLDFRSVIVPRFVYAEKSDWNEAGELSAEIDGRLGLLYEDLKRVSVVPRD